MTDEDPGSRAPAAGAPDSLSQLPATSPVGIPRIGVTPVVEPTGRMPAPRSSTLLVDSMPQRLRRTEDLLDLALSLVGIASLLVLAVYAHETTTGVTQDVQNALAVVLRRILVFPLQAVEGLVTFTVPLAVLVDRLLRRAWRAAGEAAVATVLAFLTADLVLVAITTWAPAALVSGLTVTASGTAQVGVSVVFAALAGLLTASGDRRGSSVVRVSWGAVWTVVGLSVLRGALTLPGAVISVLVGRGVGLALRYAFGVEDQRAHGIDLVRAVRRAGVDAVRVVRMDHAPDARAWAVTTDAPVGYTERVRENPLVAPLADHEVPGGAVESPQEAPQEVARPGDGPEESSGDGPGDGPGDDDASTPRYGVSLSARQAAEDAPSGEPGDGPVDTIEPAADVDLTAVLGDASSTALAEGRVSVHRLYAVWDVDGVRRDVTVLDADRQVAGFLATIWDRLRIRGLSPSRDISVRSAAEHTALMTLSARRAQVRTPSLLGMAEASESVLLVMDHVAGARSLDDLDGEVPPALLDELWEQVRRAHAAGLAHRSIDASTAVVDVTGRVWLLDWDDGEIVSSELSRRMDLAQTLALAATVAGVDGAIASASRVLSTQQVASIAPMLQAVVLPRTTREALGRRGKLLQDLRDALVELTPTAHAEPVKLTRFSPRTVIMATIGLVAVWTLLARMNFEQISEAVRGANVWWILGALVFSLATYVGAGLALVAFCPTRISLWRSTEVHLASSVVSLVAPAGVGGAAINLRFLGRQGVPTPIGVATVALVQVVQFVVTVLLLVVLAATTGQSAGLTLPSGWVMVAAGVLVAAAAAVLLFPSLRTWVWAKVEPTYKQVWPRLVWVASNPARLALGVGGTVLLSVSYILAFGASLWAFGYTLPISVLAITYLASNTVGSVVPSPGGIGPVEVALTAGLVAADIPSGVALSVALVYRLVTFWVPIPVGWLSLQRLQKVGAL